MTITSHFNCILQCQCESSGTYITDVMVSVLASSAVDRWFKPPSDQTNDYANWYL